jgi:hypothetical protein
MTEEVKVEVGTVIPGESKESSLSPRDEQEALVKDKAQSSGWMPKDEWQGDPSDWVSAREFLARQSFFDKIKSQSSEIRNLRQDIQLMSQHFSQMKEVEYKRALAELKQERKEAVSAGDTDKVESMSDQITEIETARKAAPKQQNNTGVVEFEAFKQRNEWYNTDPVLTKRANALGMGYAQMNPSASPDEVLQYVEGEIKQSIVPKKTIAPAAPDSTGVKQGPRTSGSKLTERDLTPMQKKMMDAFVQRGVLTKEKYLADLSTAEGNK